MLKHALRICAAFTLCALLVYAPEIYTAISDPYEPASAARVLLRIALCTQDAESADAFYDALTIYMKQSPTVHLRVTREGAQQLFSLPSPQPDVFVFSDTLTCDAAQRFAPVSDGEQSPRHVIPFSTDQGETLLCGVHRDSRNKDAAFALLTCLEAASASDKGDDFAP